MMHDDYEINFQEDQRLRSPVLGSGLDIPARGSCEPKTTGHDVKVLTDLCLILKVVYRGLGTRRVTK